MYECFALVHLASDVGVARLRNLRALSLHSEVDAARTSVFLVITGRVTNAVGDAKLASNQIVERRYLLQSLGVKNPPVGRFGETFHPLSDSDQILLRGLLAQRGLHADYFVVGL